MSASNAFVYFLLVLKASLFSTGGMGNLPSIHDDLVTLRGWATERQIAESLAVGQVAPGPNGLWVLSLGYLVDGVRGAALSLLAIALPPLLILVVERTFQRVGDHPAAVGFVRGLSLAVIGAFAVVLLRLVQSGDFDFWSGLIATTAAGLALLRRVPVAVIFALGALAGILLYR